MKKLLLYVGVMCLGLAPGAGWVLAAQNPQHGAAEMEEMSLNRPGDIEWQDGPASLAAGSQIAVLEGDPGQEGPFTFRLRLPDGFEIRPHWHPQVERVTVISGTFHLGMGETFDRDATEELPAGTYGYWPPGMRHFAWAEGETVLQLHGQGPWQIVYINPEDDPRNGG